MQFAHQGLELKAIPGVPAADPKGAAVAKAGSAATPPGATAGHMPRQSFEVLSAVSSMFKSLEPRRIASRPVQVGIRDISGSEPRVR